MFTLLFKLEGGPYNLYLYNISNRKYLYLNIKEMIFEFFFYFLFLFYNYNFTLFEIYYTKRFREIFYLNLRKDYKKTFKSCKSFKIIKPSKSIFNKLEYKLEDCLIYGLLIRPLKSIKLILVNIKLQDKIKFLKIKFSPSSFLKYLNISNLKRYSILYLRRNKVFNKGRYSRNRQYYRTGVYWCLYINIIVVIGIYFWFYRYSINYGYLWWILYIFIFSFLLPKIIKFKLYNFNNLVFILIKNCIWFSLFISPLTKYYNKIFLIILLNQIYSRFNLYVKKLIIDVICISFIKSLLALRWYNNYKFLK